MEHREGRPRPAEGESKRRDAKYPNYGQAKHHEHFTEIKENVYRGGRRRTTRLKRWNDKLRDDRKFADRNWRQEMEEEAQEDTIDQSQGFGDR